MLLAGRPPRRPICCARPALRPLLAAAMALGLLLGRSGAAAAMTAQAFLDATAKPGPTLDLPRYLDGFRDALFDFNAVMASVGVRVFCPPGDGPGMSSADLQARIVRSLEAKRSHDAQGFGAYAHQTSLGLVALETLSTAYPCGEQQ